MIEYIIFYAVVLFGAVISILDLEKEQTKGLYIFISFLFIILIGFRFCGYDYSSYESIFDNVKNGDEVIGIEYGFLTLCNLSATFRILLILMAFLTVFIHSKFIYKFSEIPLFSLFLLSGTLLLPTFMGQMRQGLAIGFVGFAFYYFNDKKYQYYFLFVVLAMLFHFSAIISLLFFIIPKNLKNFNYYFFTILFSVIFFQILQPFILKIMNLFPELVYLDKMVGYSENDDDKLGFNTAILIRVFVLFFCYYNKENIKSKYFPHLLNIYHYSIIIYLIFGPIIPQLGGRGTQYFSYFDLLLIPMLINSFDGFKRLLIMSIFFLLTFARLIQFFTDDFNLTFYIPYSNYLI